MKVLEHGNFYSENKIINCVCGCKYEYEMDDICIDTTLAHTTCPEQYRRYVECPECGAKTQIGTTYKHGQTIKF